MLKHTLAIDDDALRLIQDNIQALPDQVDRWVRKDIVPFIRHRVDKTLRVEPRVRRWPVDYPLGHLEWTSARQRRYFWAVLARFDAEGNYIPYQRSHKLSQGWHVLADYKNGLTRVLVTHDSDIEQYVYGRRQQRFHQITGWPGTGDVLQELSLDVTDRIYDGWQLLAASVAV